jgi:chromosome segregation ATPase
MSLEDAKNKLKHYREVKEEAEATKKQAQQEQSEIERELSRQISGAVDSAIYRQDTNINQLTNEIHKTNDNYQLLHRDMVQLNDVLRDTTHLQEVYDVKHRELEQEYKEKREELEKEYQRKLSAHKAALSAADQEYSKLDSERRKKKAKLEDEIREEENHLYNRKASVMMKLKGIIISLIIAFILAIIGGIALGYYWVANGYIEVPVKTSATPRT